MQERARTSYQAGRNLQYQEEERRKARQRPMRDRLLRAMVEVRREAMHLPQDDDRLWKYHPVARKWRRLVRAWWRLPSGAGLVHESDRYEYKGLFAPLGESLAWCNGPHFNKGGHLAKLQEAIKHWDRNAEILPELTRAAVHAIYRALPELRRRDVPTQFNLWS